MKVYAICTLTPIALRNMRLYTSKVKARANLKDNEGIVELEVDEYPEFEELRSWLETLTTSENLSGIMVALARAEKHGLGYEVIYSAYEQQDEPDFNIIDALQEGCLRWDV